MQDETRMKSHSDAAWNIAITHDNTEESDTRALHAQIQLLRAIDRQNIIDECLISINSTYSAGHSEWILFRRAYDAVAALKGEA